MTGPLKHLADVEKATMTWVRWYNTTRLHSTLAMVPPSAFKQNVPVEHDHEQDTWTVRDGTVEQLAAQDSELAQQAAKTPTP